MIAKIINNFKGHIQAAMALGLPKIKFEKYIDRGTPQYKTL